MIDGMGMPARTVLALSVVLGLLYGLGLLPTGTPALAMASKGSCVGLLAIYAVLSRNRMLAAALGFGTAGDVFLASGIESAFMLGLSAFLLGHLFYIAQLWPRRLPLDDLDPLRRAALLAVVGAGLWQGWYLLPYVPGLEIAIAVYSLALMAMTCLAAMSAYPFRLVGLGALLFFFSDVALGIALFSPDIVVPRALNWFLYYPGQLLLALGLGGGALGPTADTAKS